jgi:hypothetical protein
LKNAEENIFLTDEVRESILTIFYKIQKIYTALSRFQYIYKFKKTKFKIETDLYLSPINEKDKNVITIYQNNYKFLFTITDIIKIIKNSICNTDHFFSEPKTCKNPFNNISFTKSNLYNIYFYLKKSNYIIPDIIQNYFLTDFDLQMFREENNYIIREYAIQNYIYSLNEEDIVDEIFYMISFYNDLSKKNKYFIHVDSTFPSEKLIW